MSKKKTAPRRTTPKRPDKTKLKAARTPAPAAPRRRTQHQLALPGAEQVRNLNLDRACEQIGAIREQSNGLRTDEKAELQGALREMHDRGVNVYRHAGVELVRVPGEEKLRVRTTKEDASDITPSDANPLEEGGSDEDLD